MIDATRFFVQLGRRIRRMRESHHFTLEDMISYGLSARHWQQIEKGRPSTLHNNPARQLDIQRLHGADGSGVARPHSDLDGSSTQSAHGWRIA